MTPAELFREVSTITATLIEVGLAVEQNFPTLQPGPDDTYQVTIPSTAALSVPLRNIHYSEIYSALDSSKTFNVKLLDGGLLHFLYNLTANTITKHRLAFFPSPDLEPYQNEPDLYESDEIYADILLKNIVGVPIRFDFDSSDALHVDVHHPKSHLTLGQYKNCRIPVNAPIAPSTFIKFILRNFYNTAFLKFENELSFPEEYFDECITAGERRVLHVRNGAA